MNIVRMNAERKEGRRRERRRREEGKMTGQTQKGNGGGRGSNADLVPLSKASQVKYFYFI